MDERGLMLVVDNADADGEDLSTGNNKRNDMLLEFSHHPVDTTLPKVAEDCVVDQVGEK